MDITTISNNNQDSNEQILRYIFDITKTMLTKTNLDMIIQSIDNIEDLTGYKLFNKSCIVWIIKYFSSFNYDTEISCLKFL